MKSSVIISSFIFCICIVCTFSADKVSKARKGYAKTITRKSKDEKDVDFYQNWSIFKQFDIDWSNEDYLQQAIDETPRKVDRNIGQMCSFSSDCKSGCCLLNRSTKIRSCQPKAKAGERCSGAQVKMDVYVDACPCLSGLGE
ncbi:hypothetical protein B4U79_02734 [Dinothrombium tinctorium]|uniref:Uncharacterized protein n=1 Tax=Dinothrombium tinctorium TaxID=1965070 RepID=A0A3S3NW03_9ACAR|nr:hypothetical protein B4U79_01732 [Dinothrombium tinctorium]RWS07119.1 hypothetical protein B4U79_03823 [Dinothrombium tinctorium]RWS08442.1 hypothetical protein B4U79_02734 [Dinothrombium tinctorium]